MKPITKIINRFDKGMNNDPRIQDFRYSRLTKNFDTGLYPFKLVPHRSSEDGDSGEAKIYKNGVAIGTERSSTDTVNWKNFLEDFDFIIGDKVQLYAKQTGGSQANVRNFILYGTKISTTTASLFLD